MSSPYDLFYNESQQLVYNELVYLSKQKFILAVIGLRNCDRPDKALEAIHSILKLVKLSSVLTFGDYRAKEYSVIGSLGIASLVYAALIDAGIIAFGETTPLVVTNKGNLILSMIDEYLNEKE